MKKFLFLAIASTVFFATGIYVADQTASGQGMVRRAIYPSGTATPTPTPTLLHAINAGGAAQDGYEAGSGYQTSGDNFTDGSAINTSLLTDVPSQAVLQSYTYRNAGSGSVVYTVTGLSNVAHTVRIFLWDDGGVGTQDITINSVLVEDDIDVGADAGGNYRAIQVDYVVTPSANEIVIDIEAASGYAILPAFKIFQN